MPQPVDVYLLAGQSNMVGHGRAAEIPQALRPPHASARSHFVPLDPPGHPRLDRSHVRRWVPLAPGNGEFDGGFGLDLSLGHTLAARSPRPVALIKCDRGGTSLFEHWKPADFDDPTTLTNLTLAAAAEAWEQLLDEGLNPRLAGVVWFQGESDTSVHNPAPDRYGQQLATFFDRVRDELADGESLTKIIFRISPPPQNDRPHIESIRQQLTQLADHDPRARWIDADDLPRVDGDPLHFNGQALLTLGDRAAAALLALNPAQNADIVIDSPVTPPPRGELAREARRTGRVSPQEPPAASSPDRPHLNPLPEAEGAKARVPASQSKTINQKSKITPLPKPDAPRTLALMNQKGGVGKTTTAVNVGAALANLGLRVLCIDLDPQAHLTLSLGIDPDDIEKSNYDLFIDPDTTAMETVRYTARDDKRLAVLPAETNLAGVESELSDMIATGLAQTILRNKCKDLVKEFDYVLIDCPPSLGLLTINALTMASEIVVPMQAHFLALQGMTKLFETIGMVRQGINPHLTVAGVVLCMHEGNTLLANEVISELEGFFDAARGTDQPWANGRVFSPPVRRNIKLAEAPSFGQSVHAYAPDSNGAKDYLSLARSIAGG